MTKTRLCGCCGPAILVLLVALGLGRVARASHHRSLPAGLAAQQTGGRTLIVTSPADAGPGTLRQTLLDAQPGDTITFDTGMFPPEDPTTISVLAALDGLTQGQLTIDASNAGVILDGSRLPREGRANGLTVLSSGNRILGLQILDFPASGVFVADGQDNQIGGAGPGEGNVLSGNYDGINLWGSGTRNNVVLGNHIGTNASGTAAMGNQVDGVWVGANAQHNLVGGATAAARNLISGNGSNGVVIDGGQYNTIRGNYIGTDATGTRALPNSGSGVTLAEGARDNLIGGAAPGEGNVISGNHTGVSLAGSSVGNNVVRGNYIGTDATGKARLGNQQDGIGVTDGAGPNTIGPGNTIAYNALAGVGVSGPGTIGNTITANAIYDNGGPGIETGAGGNAEIAPPQLQSVSSRVVKGTAPPGTTIEVFYDEGEEGKVFAASTTAGEDGTFAYTVPAGAFRGPKVLVTATDSAGNTSAFSAPGSPPTSAVFRELPQVVAPTQVSTDPKVMATNLALALFCVLFFGLTSTVFNATLEDYRTEIVDGLARLVPRTWTERLRAADRSLGRAMDGGRGKLLLTWLVMLLVTALIESFLDPTIGILGTERLGLLLTLFLSAVVVSSLELASGLLVHRRWSPGARTELQVQWLGLALAIACVILSRALRFVPGYLYGIVGAVYLTPKLTGTATCGKWALLALSAVLAGSLGLWIATVFLPPALAWLEPVLLTTFLIGLQGTFFQLFPLAITDGGDLWNWRKGLWFAFFLAVFFGTYHFVLNPNGSDVQALQQNGVQTLAVLMAVFGLATALLWLLLPFRLRRRQRKF